MQIQFIATMSTITADPRCQSSAVCRCARTTAHGEDDDYHHSEQIVGCKSFGVWPLAQAVQACFGTPDWPAEHPVPQASIEFEVADAAAVEPAAAELAETGFPLLHRAPVEPWGQTVARVLSPEGLVMGISYPPLLH